MRRQQVIVEGNYEQVHAGGYRPPFHSTPGRGRRRRLQGLPSEFGAWQLLRLRPLYDPEKIFVRLLAVNRRWMKKILANNYRSQKNILLPAMITAVKVPEKSKLISGILGDWWEKFLFYGQWLYQRGHQTREVVTPQQIFFHPLIRD